MTGPRTHILLIMKAEVFSSPLFAKLAQNGHVMTFVEPYTFVTSKMEHKFDVVLIESDSLKLGTFLEKAGNILLSAKKSIVLCDRYNEFEITDDGLVPVFKYDYNLIHRLIGETAVNQAA